MPIRNDALTCPSFWAWIAEGGLGCHGGLGMCGAPPEQETVCALFSLDPDVVEQWSNEFTGWYPEILDESDGCVDNPSAVLIPCRNGIDLRIEFHPCDWSWFIESRTTGYKVLLGNVGPHWSQPGLRWQEATSLARASTPAILPLLLPMIWLTEGDDVGASVAAIAEAWSASKHVKGPAANTLARLWCEGAADGRAYRWWREPSLDWVTDSEWSSRYVKRPHPLLQELNRVLRDAGAV
jgi:hypothetical protein